MELGSEQVDFFQKNGFLVVENLLEEGELAALRSRVDLVASGDAVHIDSAQLQVEPDVEAGKEKTPETYAASLRKMSHVAFHDDVFMSHARNPKVLDVVESLLGPDLKLYQDQVFMKPPRVGSRQRYHQDMPLGFQIDPPDMVTCWAALDDATIENGCLWMLPGTHLNGVIDKAVWEEMEEKALRGDLGEEVPIPLKAGSCGFHHGLTLHSSRPNRTDRSRRGYATHYVSGRCRYTGEKPTDAVLVRGKEYEGRI
jgi:ectoine hydroxylase-related dioxygenase (phytanoyl-CoA dioxygenase family)